MCLYKYFSYCFRNPLTPVRPFIRLLAHLRFALAPMFLLFSYFVINDDFISLPKSH